MPWRAWLGAAGMVLVTSALLADWETLTRWATPIGWWSYIFVLDGILGRKGRTSPLLGRPRRLLAWSAASIGLWLVFEGYNLHLTNWHYLDLPTAPGLRWTGYLVSFATILPAVFLTTEAFGRAGLFDRRDAVGRRRRLPLPSYWDHAFLLIGAACLVVPLLVPAGAARWGFGLVWLGFFLVLDPLNGRAGSPSLLGDWRRGVWGRTLRLLAAGFTCGLLWEAWNWGAATKWVYTVPVMPELTYFEMPLAGFLGFGPFALELFAMWHTIAGLADALAGRPPQLREPRFEACR